MTGSSALEFAQHVAGVLLIAFAIVLVLSATPRRRTQFFAVLFAAVIVLTVLTGCTTSATAGAGRSPSWIALPLGPLGVGAGTAALRLAVQLVRAAGAAFARAISMVWRGVVLLSGSLATSVVMTLLMR